MDEIIVNVTEVVEEVTVNATEIVEEIIVTITELGVPPGGITGNVLKKKTDNNFDVEWGEGGGVGAVDSVNGYIGVVVLDKTDIGLSNVPNLDTSDPANITQSASYRFATDTEKSTWNGKQNALGFTPVPDTRTVNTKPLTSNITLDKTDVGLSNVPNLDTSNPANITQSASYRFATDTEKSTWNGKQNALGFVPVPNTRTVNSKALSADISITKSDVGLGNVPNLDTSNPVNITQSASYRFTTDTEKSTWNGKQDALGFVPVPNTRTVNSKALSSNITLDKTDVGLGNVPNVDTSNPVNITQSASYRFTTDTEKSTWNGKQNALGFTPIPEAPVNGTTYGRKDSGWVAMSSGSGGQKFTFVLHIGENVTVGINKTNALVVPSAGSISRVTAIAKVAPVGSAIIFDINKNGSSIWASTPANRIEIPSGSLAVNVKTSFDFPSIAIDDILTIDIDQVGSSVPGQEITVTVWAI